jgi:hypothetical protein
LILDDCCAENEFKSPVLRKMAIMGWRHYDITFIITSQYVYMIPPVLRSNSIYNAFFNFGGGTREMKATYEAFRNRFRSYEEFKTFYYKNIENHKFIIYNLDTSSYTTYRCPKTIPKFHLKFNKYLAAKK